MDEKSGKWSNTLLALSSKDLQLKGYYTTQGTLPAARPAVFEFGGKDLIVTAGSDGSLHLLDSQSAGGTDHKTALFSTPLVAASNGAIWGGLSTWEDADGVRWVAAPVWGAVNPDLKAASNGPAPNGSVVAFRVEEQGGKPVLVPAWVSRDLQSPVPPVITSGVVFALSTGGYTRQGAEVRARSGGRATLYGLDAATGKEIYSTGSQVTAAGSLTGLTVANSRVFFTTTDNTLYGFGVFLER